MQQVRFYNNQHYEQVFCYNINSFLYHWSVRPRREYYHISTIDSKLEPFNQISTNFNYLSTVPATLQCNEKKKTENLEFVQVGNCEFVDLSKSNGRKYCLTLDESYEKVCNSKAFVDVATAGRHRGLSAIYNRRNLFRQRKLGRDVERQNTKIVVFEFPRNVIQVSTLQAQLMFGSELADWHPDTTSVPYIQFLIEFSPQTQDRLRYCTNTRSFPSKIYMPELLKQPRLLDDGHTKSM